MHTVRPLLSLLWHGCQADGIHSRPFQVSNAEVVPRTQAAAIKAAVFVRLIRQICTAADAIGGTWVAASAVALIALHV
jgi:hypothetical protein